MVERSNGSRAAKSKKKRPAQARKRVRETGGIVAIRDGVWRIDIEVSATRSRVSDAGSPAPRSRSHQRCTWLCLGRWRAHQQRGLVDDGRDQRSSDNGVIRCGALVVMGLDVIYSDPPPLQGHPALVVRRNR